MLKKCKTIGLLALVMVLGITSTNIMYAKENEQKVKVNDVIEGNKGEKEIVVKVNADGTYVTYTGSINKASVKANKSCEHTSFVGYGSKYTETKSYEKKDATYCYKTRTVQQAKCAKCGKTGFKIYGDWKKYKHEYSLFGKTCKECDYKKK